MSHAVLTTAEVRQAAARLPRVDLAHLPTPLEEVPRFADAIGSGRTFVKRDDCTGLLFGGNKTRHNEFLMADALRQGADVVVWGAGVQSNNCRQTAAACAKLGIECRLYLSKAGKWGELTDVQGNLLLDYLVGAKIQIVPEEIGPDLDELLARKATELRAAGRKPYVWDRHLVKPLAAVSYVLCLAEIIDELRGLGLEPDVLYVSSAGSTGAGLALGRVLLGIECPVRSICPIRWPWDVRSDMAEIANQAAVLLGVSHRLKPEDIEASEDYIGPAYGAFTEDARQALALLARHEGILLDPVYTAKAMAALIDDVRTQKVTQGQTVVFVHTGGTPVVFSYRDAVIKGFGVDSAVRL